MTALATVATDRIGPLAAPTAVSQLSMDRQVEFAQLVTLPPAQPRDLFTAREAVERFPDSASHVARLALMELAHGDPATATRLANRASVLAADTEDTAAALLAAEVLVDTGNVTGAKAALGAAGQTSAGAYLRAQIHLIEGDVDAALAGLPDSDDLLTLQMRGWASLRAQRYPQAIHYLRRALRLNPRMPDLLANLGYAYGWVGAYDKAIGFTSQAVQLAPGKRHPQFNLVGFLVLSGQHDAALARLRDMKHRFPEDPAVDVAVADVQLRSGAPDKALRTLQQLRASPAAARLDPVDKAELSADLAYLEWRLDRTSRTEAAERIRKELRRSNYGSLEAAWLLMTVLLHPEPLVDQVDTLVADLHHRHPPDKLHGFVAYLALEHGRFQEALQAAQRWSAAEPFSEAAACAVTYLLSDVVERYDEAVKVGAQALKRLPASGVLANNVAFALAMSGHPDQARRVLQQVPEDRRPVVAVATQGAIQLVEGDVAGAERTYAHAVELAREDPTPGLGDKIAYRFAILRRQFGIDTGQPPPTPDGTGANWLLLRQLAARHGMTPR